MGSVGNDDHDDDSENLAKKLSCVLSKFIKIGPAQFVNCRRFFLDLNS